MPQFTLADYIALRTIITLAERFGVTPILVTRARDALDALRKFFPAFEQFERDQPQGDRL